MNQRIRQWLEDRTGIETAIRHFLYEDIPASAGWHQVFGSVALFSFLLQAVTGILLAFNYAPTPGEAYYSLKYIITEVTAGNFIRGLHHWGASILIIVVVLHMCQVFLWGAHKKPREATWMVGLVLLLITLAYGLTGYLLPWDNRAYWGTVVATQIGAKAPLMGSYIERLLGSENGIGVVTFARFFSIHVLILPPVTMLLIAVHVFLVRKHGVAPAAGDNLPRKKFFPGQVFKDTVAITAVFLVLVLMAALVKVPLGRLADPTDTSYIPRPDWYFLFLFQLLKFFEGPLEVVGSIILPTVAIGVLFAVPFLDRGKAMPVLKRTSAMFAVALAALGWAALTGSAIQSTPAMEEELEADIDNPMGWQQLTPEEMAGIGYFRREHCESCHALGGEAAGKIGPDLARTTRRNAAWLIQHFKQPANMVPGSPMPPVHLNASQMNALAAFLLRLNARNAEALKEAPAYAADGAVIYQSQRCGVCHQVNGSGMKTAPVLNGLARRRSRDWVEQHFAEPQKLSPGSPMPPYRFPRKDLDNLTSYLMALPDAP